MGRVNYRQETNWKRGQREGLQCRGGGEEEKRADPPWGQPGGGCGEPLGWAPGRGSRPARSPAHGGPRVRQSPPAASPRRGWGGRGVTHCYLRLRKEAAGAENGFRSDTVPISADTSRSPGTTAQPEGRKQPAARGQRLGQPHTSDPPPASRAGHPAALGGSRARPAPPPQPGAPVGWGRGQRPGLSRGLGVLVLQPRSPGCGHRC